MPKCAKVVEGNKPMQNSHIQMYNRRRIWWFKSLLVYANKTTIENYGESTQNFSQA